MIMKKFHSVVSTDGKYLLTAYCASMSYPAPIDFDFAPSQLNRTEYYKYLLIHKECKVPMIIEFKRKPSTFAFT